MSFLSQFFDTASFMPHGHCYLWHSNILFMQVIGNLSIGLAYFPIPLALISFIRRRKDLTYNGVFWLFSAFILACGVTHLSDIVMIWKPFYQIDSVLRLITGLLSMITALVLWPLIPKALAIPSASSLARKNQDLIHEIEKRKEVESELRQVQAGLEKRVADRTKELTQSEEKLRLLIEGIDYYALFLMDKEGLFASWNSGALKVLGYNEGEIVGEHFSKIFTTQDVESGIPQQELNLAAKAGVAPDERWHVKKGGERFWATGATHSIKDEYGEVIGFAKVMGDATARHRAEISLKESESKFRALIESVPQLVWSTQPDGLADYFNQQWLDYTGTTLAQNLGHYWLDQVHPDDKQDVYNTWQTSVDTKIAYEREFRIRRNDGIYEWHLVKGYPVLSSQMGEVSKWFGASTNIESQKEAEATLIRAHEAAEKANLAKSQFLANMSHEIRTPLNAILGFAELARQSDLSLSDRLSYLSIITRNGGALSELIDEILDLSKVEAGRLQIAKEEFNLGDLVTEILVLMNQTAVEKGITLKASLINTIPEHIEFDSLRLRQILINVIGNAIKFTKYGQVSLEIEEISGVLPQIQFLIKDTGVGIDPKYRDQLFQPFTQADYDSTRRFGGTGLGLSLSQKLCELLGGNISLLDSELGKGSIFCIVIPLSGLKTTRIQHLKATNREMNSAADSSKPLEGLTILVAEDSPDNQFLIRRILTTQGAITELVENGKEAVEKALSQTFDLILMDVQMPVMDGISAVKRLRKEGYQKPIVALTAHALKEERQRCLEAGFDEHVAKPINQKELLRKILVLTTRDSDPDLK